MCQPGFARKSLTVCLVLMLACVGSADDAATHGLRLERNARFVLHGGFFHNGNLFPASVYEHASIWLVPTGSGEPLLLGKTHHGSYRAIVPEGSYSLYYDHGLGTAVPRNNMARISGPIFVDGPQQLDVEVFSTTLSGSLLVNGKAAPNSLYESSEISLHRDDEPAFVIGNTRDRTYSVSLLMGAYHAIYQNLFSTGETPSNNFVEVDQRGVYKGPATWDIDVPMISVTVEPLLNGGAFPTSAYEQADIRLRHVNSGDEIEVGSTRDGAITLSLVPGVYDAVYDHLIGQQIPLNRDATVLENVLVEADELAVRIPSAYLPVPVATAFVQGDFRLDGGSFPDSIYEQGHLSLVQSNGSVLELGDSRDRSYEAVVLPGSYVVQWDKGLGGNEVPMNPRYRVQSVVLATGDNVLDIDVPTVQLIGDILAPPGITGGIWMRQLCKDCDWFHIADFDAGSYGIRLGPGVYDIVFSQGESAAAVEADHEPGVEGVFIYSDLNQNLHVGDGIVGTLMTP